MGVEIKVDGLSKSFGNQLIWGDVTLTVPAGEISVMLGPSGTGKSVFLKTLIGLLKPDKGHIHIEGVDIATCREKELYEIRKLFGVLFQDGAMFGSMHLYDNVAFPLREHTKKSESEIRQIVMEKMELVGLVGAEYKLPGEISGGMRKRAGLARALVLDPEIVLFDEPDSGLDPVRTAFLNQLIVDLNAQIEATMLIVTHDINTARTVPDNIGLLYHRHALKHHNDEDARKIATTAIASAFNTAPARAEKAATAILSYDYLTLDQDAASAVKYMTPQAAAEYQITLKEVVSKPATAVKAQVTAKVMLSGVASARPDEVDVLLFVDQTSSTTSHRDPQTSLNRVVFTMVKSGDAWLVDKITAL